MKRLNTVVSSLVLRRTKEDIDKTLNLTKRSIESHTITLQDEEKQVYSILFTEARKVRDLFTVRRMAIGTPSPHKHTAQVPSPSIIMDSIV